MKVLVTGANGFLGSHVVRTLNDKGYQVKAFILKGSSIENLQGLSYEKFEGDLLKFEDINQAMHDCDVMIHTAAMTDIWPNRNPKLWQINYDVIKNIAFLAKQNHLEKLIHVGTANSFGYGSKEHPGTELSPYHSSIYELDYMDSKKAAQDYLLEESKHGLPVVIINPTFMIGENDSKPGSGQMIISIINQNVPGYAKGGRCFAPVKDVANAIVNAIDLGEVGQCYITGGKNLTYHEFFHMISQMTKVKEPKIKFPYMLSVIAACMMQIKAYFSHRKPKLTIAMAKISRDGHYYSSDKAIKDLNYQMTDLEVALQEAIHWYETNGYIKGDK